MSELAAETAEITDAITIAILPGGRMPQRMSAEAAGYDVYARAIVDAHLMDPENPQLRQTIFDFENIPPSADIQEHIVHDPDNNNLWAYELSPGERILVGIGFATQMKLPLFYWVTPRSGLASKSYVTLGNAPGTVDADYRGEAGVIVKNESTDPFLIQRGMRIAQILFAKVEIPEFIQVGSIHDLSDTQRSAGGFGSTGLR